MAKGVPHLCFQCGGDLSVHLPHRQAWFGSLSLLPFPPAADQLSGRFVHFIISRVGSGSPPWGPPQAVLPNVHPFGEPAREASLRPLHVVPEEGVVIPQAGLVSIGAREEVPLSAPF